MKKAYKNVYPILNSEKNSTLSKLNKKAPLFQIKSDSSSQMNIKIPLEEYNDRQIKMEESSLMSFERQKKTALTREILNCNYQIKPIKVFASTNYLSSNKGKGEEDLIETKEEEEEDFVEAEDYDGDDEDYDEEEEKFPNYSNLNQNEKDYKIKEIEQTMDAYDFYVKNMLLPHMKASFDERNFFRSDNNNNKMFIKK